jgi:hypothetical protein
LTATSVSERGVKFLHDHGYTNPTTNNAFNLGATVWVKDTAEKSYHVLAIAEKADGTGPIGYALRPAGQLGPTPLRLADQAELPPKPAYRAEEIVDISTPYGPVPAIISGRKWNGDKAVWSYTFKYADGMHWFDEGMVKEISYKP